MRSNKKIIALLCAFSMIFSMFASFTVANAEGDYGITLVAEQSKDGTSATITAKANDGYKAGILAGSIALSIPDGATATATSEMSNADYTAKDGKITLGFYSGDNQVAPNDVLGVFTFTGLDITDTETITLLKGTELSYIDGNDTVTYAVEDATNPIEAVSVTLYADPTATPKPTAKPAPDPVETDPPSVKEPVEVGEKGISLSVADEKDADGNYVITAKQVGFSTGILAGSVVLNVPDGATATATSEMNNADYTAKDGKITLGFYSGDNQVAPNDVIGIFKIKSDDVPFDVQLQAGTELSYIDGNDTITYAVGNAEKPINAVWATVGATKSSIGTTTSAAELIPTYADLIDDAKDKGAKDTPYYAVVTATKNGQPATYGTDYVAYYNGVKLSEAQMNNYLTGQYGKVEDALKNMTFEYAPGVTLEIELDSKESTTPLASGTTTPATPTPTPAVGASGVKLATLKKSINTSSGKQSNTATVSVGTDTDGTALAYGTLTINVTTDSFDVVSGTGIAVEYTPVTAAAQAAATTNTKTVYVSMAQAGTDYALPQSADNKYTISFTPISKGTVTYTVVYTDPKGTKSEQTAVYTVTAAANNNGGSSGGGGSSSGGGAIASGNLNTGTAGTLPGTFSDLADASWATEAITALAAKGIVSGLGDGTFDPNGALTRAAYAQMLVNAIGKQGEAADVSFDDVPTDAWFYHNVAVAAKYGIVSGYGDGNFGPYDLITREQMALMTLKAAQVMSVNLAGASVGAFSDDADIADWSRDAVYTLADAGIINGMGDGTFAPKANATRAQAATIIYNTFVK